MKKITDFVERCRMQGKSFGCNETKVRREQHRAEFSEDAEHEYLQGPSTRIQETNVDDEPLDMEGSRSSSRQQVEINFGHADVAFGLHKKMASLDKALSRRTESTDQEGEQPQEPSEEANDRLEIDDIVIEIRDDLEEIQDKKDDE
uniref:CACTA en-spm transposon protein n=2 Tax=Bursaphelenchus xylophilus TaxID=6326 RepID=A0A1I7SHD8_BURXY